MKKYFLYFIISVVIVIIGVAFYMGILKKQAKESLLDRIPASQPHQHVSPDGEIVQHIHTQITPPVVRPKTIDTETTSRKHPILRIWEDLDLAEIRRKYQPYTVPEMMEKWHQRYMDINYPSRSTSAAARLARKMDYDAYWSTEAWLQHLLDNGFPFLDFGHYKMAFDTRARTVWRKEDYEDPEKRERCLSGLRLSPDATWEELEEVSIKFDIVSRFNEQRAIDADPSVFGGVTSINGVFMPFSQNEVKVYVHVSEDKFLSTFTGAMLSEEQKNELTMYGVAPKGVTVVYTDENSNPLPADIVPRFYERKMAALEASEAHVEQMIADHESLFKTLPKSSEKTVTEPGEQLQPQETQPHSSEVPKTTDTGQRVSPSTFKGNIPPELLPPDPPSRANIHQWFEVLQELHGGELPKDLRVLQEAINELEAIRQAGKEKMQPPRQRPPERSAPKPPDAPE